MEQSSRHTKAIVSIRANLLELVVIAIVIALGVNILAGMILSTMPNHTWWAGLGGVVLIGVGLAYLVARAVP